MNHHPAKASKFLQNQERATWQDKALWHVRKNRDKARNEVRNWEELRDLASLIKDHTLNHIYRYIQQFETNARKNGWNIHWASDAKMHNSIVLDILNENNISKVVKSKSMLTEECGLNAFLERNNVQVTDTDLGERIVQIARMQPSHIVLPAIHLRKDEISELFHNTYQSESGNSDPAYLSGIARQNLRQNFYTSGAAMSGVNFAIADTGSIVVCTNEGNADMGIHHAELYIACMGIEKLIPGKDQLPVFLKLLARSATGQSITTYTSHLIRPPEGKKYHLIIVDNGRTEILTKRKFKESLKCIRCGACMNTCPVYRRSGGYSYGYTIPGPIGSILGPLRDIHNYSDLPYASSLCGSCTDVCPVKINLHNLLYELRKEVVKKSELPLRKRIMFFILGLILFHNLFYRIAGGMYLFLYKKIAGGILYNSINLWSRTREMPEPPAVTFRDWYKRNAK